jgi:hypothetical protein
MKQATLVSDETRVRFLAQSRDFNSSGCHIANLSTAVAR